MFNSSIRYKKNSHKELNFTQSKENMVVTQYNKCPTWIKKRPPLKGSRFYTKKAI